MAKYPVGVEPVRHLEYQFGQGGIEIGGKFYPVLVPKRPTTVTIINLAAINDDDWHAVTTGQTEVMEWKLQEAEGLDFYYAYVPAPTTYMSCLGGYLQRQTEITQVYVKRVNTSDTLNMQLEIWSS